MKKDISIFENKVISKTDPNDKVLIKMIKSWFKLLKIAIGYIDAMFKYAILGLIAYTIAETVGQFEAIAFLLIGISVKLSLLLSKK